MPKIHDSEMCWIFNHLEKSGGSTVRVIVNPPFGRPGKGLTLYYSKEWLQGDNFTSNLVPRLGNEVRVLSGGYVEALRRYPTVVDKCKFFTVFRHPVSRMVSAYFFCKDRSGDPLCGSPVVDAKKVDILSWAKHWGNYALRQFSVDLIPVDEVLHYIDGISSTDGSVYGVRAGNIPGWVLLKYYLQHLGRSSSIPEDEHEEVALLAMLERVMDNVAQYTAVGITEEFNASMSLYDSTLNIPGINWVFGLSAKGTVNKDRKHETEEEKIRNGAFLSSEIKRYLRLDILLYDHALAVFRHQLGENGIGF